MEAFVHEQPPGHIVFGRGSSATVGEQMKAHGLSRALVLSTPEQSQDADALAQRLDGKCVGVHARAAVHTPVEVTAVACDAYASSGADCVVSLGGGSTTGLGKAIAARTGAPQIVVPTTYAGSEVTPILGETENGVKTTRRGAEILPEIVIYDPDLTDSLPMGMSVTSGLNAMAHAAEGVYARDASPIYRLMALEGLRTLRDALPAIVADPNSIEGRDGALYGAWLCGTVLGGVGMSIHHKLCHTLGGSLNLPHADTHAILLPHTIAFVEAAVPDALTGVANLFNGEAGGGLYDFAVSLNAPLALRDLGVAEGDLDRMAAQAMASPYWCPRPLEEAALRQLLQRAWSGERPLMERI